MACTFIHVTDLHLGLRVPRFSEEVAKKLYEARFQALENVGKQTQAAFVLIAGDLFNDNNVSIGQPARAH